MHIPDQVDTQIFIRIDIINIGFWLRIQIIMTLIRLIVGELPRGRHVVFLSTNKKRMDQ